MTDTLDHQRTLRINLHKHSPEARQRLALSVRSLAALAGLNIGVVKAIEAGDEAEATMWDLQRLAKTLGLTFHGLPRSTGVFEDDDVC